MAGQQPGYIWENLPDRQPPDVFVSAPYLHDHFIDDDRGSLPDRVLEGENRRRADHPITTGIAAVGDLPKLRDPARHHRIHAQRRLFRHAAVEPVGAFVVLYSPFPMGSISP